MASMLKSRHKDSKKIAQADVPVDSIDDVENPTVTASASARARTGAKGNVIRNYQRLQKRKALLLKMTLLFCALAYLWYLHTSTDNRPVAAKDEAFYNESDWQWFRYSKQQEQEQARTPKKKMLIAQSAGFGKYMKMLDTSQRVSRAYARKWGYDYVAHHGFAMGATTEAHATFNKIALLNEALSQRDEYNNEEYDGVLILDTDIILLDLDIDIADLLDDRYALLAPAASYASSPNSWAVCVGYTLWNLRHPNTGWIAAKWRQYAQWSMKYTFNRNQLLTRFTDDQAILQIMLLTHLTPNQRRYTVNASVDMGIPHLNMLQHVTRPFDDRFEWAGHTDSRIETMQQLANQTCAKYKPVCDGIPFELER